MNRRSGHLRPTAGICHINHRDRETCCVCYVVKTVYSHSKTFCLWDITVIEVKKQSEMCISLSLCDHIQMEELLIARKKAACPCGSDPMWRQKAFVCFTTTPAKLSPDMASRASVVFIPSSHSLQLFPHLSSLLILSCLFSSYHSVRIFQELRLAVTLLMNCNELLITLSRTNMHWPTLKKKVGFIHIRPLPSCMGYE